MCECVAKYKNTGKWGENAENMECKVSKMSAKPDFSSWPLLNYVCHGHNSCFQEAFLASVPCYITDRTGLKKRNVKCSAVHDCFSAAVEWTAVQHNVLQH